jgi:DNA polymerase type B, organellar and viral
MFAADDDIISEESNELLEIIERVQNNQITFNLPPEERGRNSYSAELTFTTVSFLRRSRSLTLQIVEREMYDLFQTLLDYVRVREGLYPTDRIQIVFQDREFVASTKMVEFQSITPQQLFEIIMAILQSQETFDFLQMEIVVRVARRQRAGAPLGMYKDFEDYAKRKGSIFYITSSYALNDCMFQCLAMGIAFYNDPDEWKRMTKNASKQSNRSNGAARIAQSINASLHQPCSFDQVEQVARRYTVNVHIFDFPSLRIVYQTQIPTASQDIYLLFQQQQNSGHVHLIHPEKVGALWKKSKFCKLCNRAYEHVTHLCLQRCRGCLRSDCEGSGPNRRLRDFKELCRKCNYRCYDLICLSRHKCDKYKRRCGTCNRVYKKTRQQDREDHQCGMYRCTYCEDWIALDQPTHQCYHQPLHKSDLKEVDRKYIVYDYEAVFDENMQHHEAGISMQHLYEPDSLQRFRTSSEFLDYLLVPEHRGYTCIAHNSARYDIHYLKMELLKRGLKTEDIVNGNSYFQVSIDNWRIRFIDSYKFIPVALRKFPKTFGLDPSTLAKGYFPYRFFTTDRLTYVGPMPTIDWFDFDRYSKVDRESAIQWYREHQNDTINLYEMCMSYCDQDVRLLARGLEVFRDLFLKISDNEIDPFKYITIASVVKTLYNRKFLQPGQIAIMSTMFETIPWSVEDYFQRFHQHQLPLYKEEIYHLSTPTTLTIFRQCYATGCPRCFKPYSMNRLKHCLMVDLDYEFRRRIERLRESEQQVIIIRECEVQHLEPPIPETPSQLLVTTYTPRIDLREHFFGGRTETICMLYRCLDPSKERIYYYDYTSLYPSVMFGKVRGVTAATCNQWRDLHYPIGHPTLYTPEQRDWHECFGMVYCTTQAPEDLYLPVLPSRGDGKLLFDAQPHTGAWTTLELLKAEQLGYRITNIRCILHWSKTSTTLFRDYIRTFYQLKQQCGGWEKMGLDTNASDEEKYQLLEQFRQHFDMEINPDQVAYNPGMYMVMKLCLNSLWGKYAQRSKFTNTVDVFDEMSFWEVVDNDAHDIENVFFHDAITRSITYRPREHEGIYSPTTNLAVAIFTTAHARLRLYEAAEVCNEHLLYMDTDSLIFVQPMDQPPLLQCGPLLGDLSNELAADEYITEFVSTGPKSYAYRCSNDKQVLKVKGITMDGLASQQLTMEHMTSLIVDGTYNNEDHVKTAPLKFVIDDYHRIHTDTSAEKIFRVTQDKRQRQPADKVNTVVKRIRTVPLR